jgi:hypothetical protein
MKYLAVLALLILCAPGVALDSPEEAIEATTAISLPVDSVTIYPDGLVSVRRTGSLEVTEGIHKFVVDISKSADEDTVLLAVTNATTDRVVYDGNPVYTLNFSSSGIQRFALSYLMYNAGSWEPRYDLHLANESMALSASAKVRNKGGEELKNVRLKLVAGLPPIIEGYRDMLKLSQLQQNIFAAKEVPAPAAPPGDGGGTGELETLFMFELEGRKTLEMDKDIGLPLFNETVPVKRMYTWDAYLRAEGPASEEIRANNTMSTPWPAGKALLYRDGEYVSTIELPYTPTGTNASMLLGSSADLKVSKKLKDYNVTESIKTIKSGENATHAVKETMENWTYRLTIKSNLDRAANVEVSDTRPKEAKILAIAPKPTETTATTLKWKLAMAPRQNVVIEYIYQKTATQPLNSIK